jgi:DNA/RNA endonuclease YhcR with UshA esterase domain
MKPTHILLPISMLLFLLSVSTYADDKPASDSPTVINAGDSEALNALMGKDKEATVEGTVSNANWSRSGSIFFINFKEAKTSKFSAVFFKKNKEAIEKAFDGDVPKALKGGKIQVTGKIIQYPKDNGHPEIVIDKPEQIKVIEKPEAGPDEKKDADAKDKEKDKEESKDKEKKE